MSASPSASPSQTPSTSPSQVLGLHVPLPPGTAEHERPVVFVGPFEHHSNLLPWRESSALVVTIPEDAAGQVGKPAPL